MLVEPVNVFGMRCCDVSIAQLRCIHSPTACGSPHPFLDSTSHCRCSCAIVISSVDQQSFKREDTESLMNSEP